MNEEQHRPRSLAGLRRAEPLAIHPQRNIVFLVPVFAAPDLAVLRRSRNSAFRGHYIGESPGNEAKSCALDDGTARQRMFGMNHGFLPVVPGFLSSDVPCLK